MTRALPFISVVVPAHNRPTQLGALLSAIAEQSYPTAAFEVLVCDDGSNPALAELIPFRHAAFSLRFLRRPQAGPAAARNRGLNEARGTIVAFMDDDCLPDPAWLESIAEAFADPNTFAVHGPVRSSCPPIEFFVHSLSLGPEQGVATANFAARKECLLALDGFDATFEAPYFEDEDLARRLEERYGEIAWSDGMVVEHPPRKIGWSQAWRAATYWHWLPYFRRRHPEAWSGALPGVYRRIVLKTTLLLLGAAPVLGAPGVFFFSWAVLFAWQARRLKSLLSLAMQHGWRIDFPPQMAFLALEWLLDYRRAWSAWQGRDVQMKPQGDIETELGF